MTQKKLQLADLRLTGSEFTEAYYLGVRNAPVGVSPVFCGIHTVEDAAIQKILGMLGVCLDEGCPHHPTVHFCTAKQCETYGE